MQKHIWRYIIMTMIEFLNKHANGEDTILGYWYEDADLEGLTDYAIIHKCVFLDMNKTKVLESIFGERKVDEFIDDYTALAIELGIDLKPIIEEVNR